MVKRMDFEGFNMFGREAMDAMAKSAGAAAKTMEAMNAETLAYARQSFEDGMAATRAMMAAKSLPEAMEIQSAYAKTALDHFMSQSTRMSEMAMEQAKTAFAPFQTGGRN